MGFKTDNLGRIIHDTSGIVVGYKDANGIDRFHPIVLAQSAAPVSVTGTTAETALASVTIPGGLLGPSGTVRVTTVWSCTNNADNKTINTRLGGTAVSTIALTTSASYSEQRAVRNRNAFNSQVVFGGVFGGFGSSGAAVTTLAKDTTVDQVLAITGTLAVGTDMLTLESYIVEILPGA